MKAFTLMEQATLGVAVQINMGAETHLGPWRVGRDLKEVARAFFVEEYRELKKHLPKEEETEELKRLLAQTESFLDGHAAVEFLFTRLDVAGDELIPEQDVRDRRALLLVETVPGGGGHISITANNVIETVDRTGWVTRVPGPFPPPGITVNASKPEAYSHLLTLLPGASFRIKRSGKLEGAPHTLVVQWQPSWQRDHLRGKIEEYTPQMWGMKVFARTKE